MVAIKDMEMPSCCEVCDFRKSDPYSGEVYCNKAVGSNAIIYEDEKLENCPLVEIEECKHGKWEHDKLFGECAYVCSFCHTIWTSSEIQNMHYCPTCGAEMRGSENEVD